MHCVYMYSTRQLYIWSRSVSFAREADGRERLRKRNIEYRGDGPSPELDCERTVRYAHAHARQTLNGTRLNGARYDGPAS